MFNGLFNFDAKFWRTVIPLLTQPGVVSKKYIEGKRQRYTNPFRFYLTASILFFLVVGIAKTKKKYEDLGKQIAIESKKNTEIDTTNTVIANNSKKIDSLKQSIDHKMKNFAIPIPKKTREKILAEVDEEITEETLKELTENDTDKIFNVQFNGSTKLDKLVKYQNKNPDLEIDDALDSLHYEKNFTNRFLYTRAKAINSLTKNKETRDQFINQLFSYGSIALFIFLPFFTVFLKLFYIRGKYTYVDHLIFVFHTQTVFFMLFTIYYLLSIFGMEILWIFIVLFLLYLFLAMRKFYQQKIFKTFVKFSLLNLCYLIIGSFGTVIVLIISFALY